MMRRISMTMLAMLIGSGCYFAGAHAAAQAQNRYGIKLNPGERLVAVNGVPVNGVPVNQSASQPAATSTTSRPVTQPSTTAAASPSAKPVSSGGSMYAGSDQERAQAEANYMAQNGIKGHVGGQIGSFEGCGWSSGGMPSTCTPGYGMTLTADAIAHGRDGVYRVRAWR